jgi:hypothetical protein
MAVDTFTLRTIHATLGALEVGVLVCMLLLGASTVQAYMYYSKFPLDDRGIKTLVSFICDVVLKFRLIWNLGCFSPVREVFAAVYRTPHLVSTLGLWNGHILS